MKQHLIAEITKAVTGIKTCKFISLTYLTKSAGKLSRYTLNVGFSYKNLLEKSITELEILISEDSQKSLSDPTKWDSLHVFASQEVMKSLKKSLDSHNKGEQNPDYTKRGQYIPIGCGVNVNTNDNTIQLFGLLHSEVELIPGVYPKVNSAPLTIAKKHISKLLSLNKFREFAIDLSQVAQVKVNGETLEMEPLTEVVSV